MPGRHAAPRSPRDRWLLPSAATVAVVLAVVLPLVLIGSPGAGRPATRPLGAAASPPAASTPTPAATATTPSPASAPAAHPKHRRPKPATLDVRITGGASYVQVRRPGGRVLYDGTLRHGAHRWFDQPTLRVVIGDAGATRLVIRGKVHGPAGRRGQVLRFTITAHRVRGY